MVWRAPREAWTDSPARGYGRVSGGEGSSAVGFIALFGIAVQNSLVLLTQTRDFLAEGHTQDQAIRLASIQRLRPKLMTASCAMLGRPADPAQRRGGG